VMPKLTSPRVATAIERTSRVGGNADAPAPGFVDEPYLGRSTHKAFWAQAAAMVSATILASSPTPMKSDDFRLRRR
jgi:hypothetical protein